MFFPSGFPPLPLPSQQQQPMMNRPFMQPTDMSALFQTQQQQQKFVQPIMFSPGTVFPLPIQHQTAAPQFFMPTATAVNVGNRFGPPMLQRPIQPTNIAPIPQLFMPKQFAPFIAPNPSAQQHGKDEHKGDNDDNDEGDLDIDDLLTNLTLPNNDDDDNDDHSHHHAVAGALNSLGPDF